jgi:hypothetical protein
MEEVIGRVEDSEPTRILAQRQEQEWLRIAEIACCEVRRNLLQRFDGADNQRWSRPRLRRSESWCSELGVTFRVEILKISSTAKLKSRS